MYQSGIRQPKLKCSMIRLIIFLGLIMPVLASSCSRVEPTIPPVTTSTNSPSPDPTSSTVIPAPVLNNEVKFGRVIWNPDSIYFFGKVGVPDATFLNTKLFKNEQPVEWWAYSLKAYVLNGHWQVSIKALERQAPARFPDYEAGYSLRIWDPDNAQIDTTFSLQYPMPKTTPIFTLKDTRWKLVSLYGQDLIPGTAIEAFFDGNGTVNGKGTPNFYGGKYYTDAPDKIIIYDITMTLLGSSVQVAQQENNYFRCLRSAAIFSVDDNQLKIFSDLQVLLLVFQKIS